VFTCHTVILGRACHFQPVGNRAQKEFSSLERCGNNRMAAAIEYKYVNAIKYQNTFAYRATIKCRSGFKETFQTDLKTGSAWVADVLNTLIAATEGHAVSLSRAIETHVESRVWAGLIILHVRTMQKCPMCAYPARWLTESSSLVPSYLNAS
jgi:hypothetical protein